MGQMPPTEYTAATRTAAAATSATPQQHQHAQQQHQRMGDAVWALGYGVWNGGLEEILTYHSRRECCPSSTALLWMPFSRMPRFRLVNENPCSRSLALSGAFHDGILLRWGVYFSHPLKHDGNVILGFSPHRHLRACVCALFGQGKSWPRKSMNEPSRHVASQGCLYTYSLLPYMQSLHFFLNERHTRSMGIKFLVKRKYNFL